MASIDLSTYGKDIKHLYDAIVGNDPGVSWAVFNYEVSTTALKPVEQGSGDLDEFIECFDDGKIQYGFARVSDPNTVLPKFVLVGWCGEGVPGIKKGHFPSQFGSVAKYLHSYHVQITARSIDDIEPSLILKKVADASGSKYSVHSKAVPAKPKYSSFKGTSGSREEDWGDDAPPITESTIQKVPSAYKPTKVDIASIRAKAAAKKAPTPAPPKRNDEPFSTSSSYKPVGKVDISALKNQGRNSPFASDRPDVVKGAYVPVGKVDIAAIRAQAKARGPKQSPAPTPNAPPPADEEEYVPQSLSDRKKAFNQPPNNNEDEDYQPKSLKERMAAFNKPSATSSKPTPAKKSFTFKKPAPVFGTVAPTPDQFGFAHESKAISGANKNLAGTESGKTPAQIWAEKHGKVSSPTTSTPASPPPPSVPQRSFETAEEEEDEPHKDISSLRNRFAQASVSENRSVPPPPARQEEEESSDDEQPAQISFLKSKVPSAASTPNAATPPPPMPVRNLPPAPESYNAPPPPARNVPVSIPLAAPVAADSDEEEEEAAPPPPPRAVPEPSASGFGAPPPSLPSRPAAQEEAAAPPPPPRAVPEPESEEEEEEEIAAPQPVRGGNAVGTTAIAQYEYEQTEDNEISFDEDERITDIEFVDEDWWLGTNNKGERGLFPANYVELEKDEPVAVAAAAAAAPAAIPVAQEEEETEGDGPSAIVEYDYEAAEENEFDLKEGDTIYDIEFVDEDWWLGTLRGERKLFPANYVTLNEKS